LVINARTAKELGWTIPQDVTIQANRVDRMTDRSVVVPESRKLAAILAADVAGYSKLAAADEERTLARLRALRSDLFDPTIALHHGRVVKRTGDGVLIEFRSVVDAVRCAIEVQNGMVERNAGLPPDRRIEFRVGIIFRARNRQSTAQSLARVLRSRKLWRMSRPNGN
jgi:class 3 adenylate cyclase